MNAFPVRYYHTPRTHEYYNFPPNKRFSEASFKDVWEAGLNQEVLDGIAHIEEVEGYHIAVLPQIASHSPYGFLTYVFPDEGRPIRHGLHEYASPKVGKHIIGMAVDFSEATAQVAQEREELDYAPRVIVNQHVGGMENTRSGFFRTTTRHTHLHTFTWDERIIRNHPDLYQPAPPPLTDGEQYLFSPTISGLAKVLLGRSFPSIQSLDGEGLQLGTYQAGQTEKLASDWSKLHNEWSEEWFDFASVFSKFGRDDNGRYKLRTRQEIAESIDDATGRLRTFGAAAADIRIFRTLGRIVQSSENVPNQEKWFYRGPCGLIALNYLGSDMDLSMYPRLRVTSDKSAYQMRSYRTIKDRQRVAAPESIQKVKTILRAIIAKGQTLRQE